MDLNAPGVAAERAGSTVAVLGGAWAWLAENQQPIAALCAIVGACVGVIGLCIHLWSLYRGRHQK